MISEKAVEAAARALCASDEDPLEWDELLPFWQGVYCRQAKAALEAVLSLHDDAPKGWKLVPVELTEAMRGVAWRLIRGNLRPDEIWKDMVDAAPDDDPRYRAKGSRTIPLSTLKWWRELVDLNPRDLAPRLDALIAEKDGGQ